MNCYQFCHQYEDYFEIFRGKRPNTILFAPLFLRGLVTQQWFQYKQSHDGAAPMTWQEFKDFFQKKLKDCKTFVNSIWSKMKRDSYCQDKSVQD